MPTVSSMSSAKDKGTGKEAEIRLNLSGLSKEEIERNGKPEARGLMQPSDKIEREKI